MKATEIAQFLNSTLYGQDIDINGVSELSSQKANTLVFCKYGGEIRVEKDVLLICSMDNSVSGDGSFIRTSNPRLSHAQAVKEFFCPEGMIPDTDGRLINSPWTGAFIYDCVSFGSRCFVKPGAVIGHSGFGYEKDSTGVPFLRPHTGGVTIGNNVTIGVNSTIARGTIRSTVISDNVKIDDHVHVGHNVVIGENTLITAGAVIGGSSVIGKNVWIGLNATIMNNIRICDGSVIGIGANVIKSVDTKSTIVGFMGQPLDRRSFP